MKKTFESFSSCLELREVIFLRSLPTHAHLVPAYDIFLDPMSKKLHICMEHMDINLYQLMKERDHKSFDGASVKSILFQILSGLEHIHAHHFFHRDIKPENIMVTCSASSDPNSTVRRYSALATPPCTPPVYSVKIADFGLARETHSKLPYTTYVSTRWYRAPEVLLRAGEYSAPVDIWALGAMAVEIASLKPLFPGGNEVDQVWRVCEIMGSPGNWYNKAGSKVGGGDWREGTKLASKLGFSFPKVGIRSHQKPPLFRSLSPFADRGPFKMAPHSIDTVLQAPRWPASLSKFVTWCLMWDPRNRPTSTEALNHEYFHDAVDPLRPRSAASRMMNRKQSDLSHRTSSRDALEPTPVLHSKPSWFRKSLIGRESAPAIPQLPSQSRPPSPHPSPAPAGPSAEPPIVKKTRPSAEKRATWAHGLAAAKTTTMPFLPMLRPISPLSDPVTAQGNAKAAAGKHTAGEPPIDNRRRTVLDDKAVKKIGRQLSVASNGNHYAELHRQEAERALNGNGEPATPVSAHKESFFSHLRKRARRLSGRNQLPASPNVEDVEASAGCGPWTSNRSSMALDPSAGPMSPSHPVEVRELDGAGMQNARYSVDASSLIGQKQVQAMPGCQGNKKRPQPARPIQQSQSSDSLNTMSASGAPISSRSRRAAQMSSHPVHRYEAPDEEDELLDEVINSAHRAAQRLDRSAPLDGGATVRRPTQACNRSPLSHMGQEVPSHPNPYPTPSPSSKRNSVYFGQSAEVTPSAPIDVQKRTTAQYLQPKWPTPPYEDNDWADAAAASLYAAGAAYR